MQFNHCSTCFCVYGSHLLRLLHLILHFTSSHPGLIICSHCFYCIFPIFSHSTATAVLQSWAVTALWLLAPWELYAATASQEDAL